MKLFTVGFATAALLFAADSATIWNAHDVAAKLAATKPDQQKITQDSLGKFPGYALSVTKREGSGIAELHKTQNDVLIVQSGGCTLVTGGTIVDPKDQSPVEVRGSSIQGGERRKISVGDVIHIPINTPHQMLLDPGKSMVYAVVKTDVR